MIWTDSVRERENKEERKTRYDERRRHTMNEKEKKK